MIYVTHGILPMCRAQHISHALLLPELSFERHLQRRSTKYVCLKQAMAGAGDALTIDDATHAGFQAAMLARRYGHAVSWFVNGANVEDGLPYFPFQLSCMLDHTQRSECLFEGRHWGLRSMADRRAFRFYLKQRYMGMRSQPEIEQLVGTVSISTGVDSSAMGRPLATITSAELTAAAAAGVDLQNHSWSHLNPQVLSERTVTEEVHLNEHYLSHFRNTNFRGFAPAFGKQVGLPYAVFDLMVLADRDSNSFHVNARVVNRRELLLAEHGLSAAAPIGADVADRPAAAMK